MTALGGARDRINRMLVVVNPGERERITALAKAAGLSLSAYLRSCALGYEPRSVFDLQAARDMLKVNGDLGRLGGLLKMRLSEQASDSAHQAAVRQLLDEIEAVALELRSVIARL